MLKLKRTHKNIVFFMILISISGCGRIWNPGPIGFVKVPPPFPQALTVRNDSGEIINIHPDSDSEGGLLVLDPGESASLKFTVERIAELDESGSPKVETWTAEIDESSLYIGMMDADGVLTIERLSGEVWSYRIALGTCWFENNPPTDGHELVVEDEEPPSGIPVLRLCE